MLEVRTASKHVGMSGEGTQRWTGNARKGITRGAAHPQPVPTGMALLAAGLVLKKCLLQTSSPTRIQNGLYNSLCSLPSLCLPFQGSPGLLQFPAFLLFLSPHAKFD